MKIRVICLIFIIYFLIGNTVRAESISTEIINETKDKFNIKSFVKEAESYSKDLDVNVSNMINSAISGKIDNSTFIKKIINVFGKEILNTIKTMVGILIIVLIHSIIKAISDGLESSEISNVIYYVEYILIVTIVMNNFSDILRTITNTVNNLIGFMNTLLPLLVSLMIYTGSITTSSLLEPIILFVISLLGNVISKIIIPGISLIMAIIIVSKISDKIQIVKLANFMKSSIVWLLGIILTLFVGILSLEGTLTSSIDGITAKTAKAAVSNLIPVVGKVLGDSVDSVLGCGVVLKNAIGIVGIIIIIRNLFNTNHKISNFNNCLFNYFSNSRTFS